MKRLTDAEVLLRLLGETCDCCCECEHQQGTATRTEAAPARPQMFSKKMPPLTVIDTDQPFVPSYPSFDSPQRAANLGLPHIPLLIDPDPGSDRAHEGRFEELQVSGSLSNRTMVLNDGTVTGTGSIGNGPLVIDQDARTVLGGPREFTNFELAGAPITGLVVTPTQNGSPGYGVTTAQPQAGYPEQGGQDVPLTDTSGNKTSPTGTLPRYNLLDTRTYLTQYEWQDGIDWDGRPVRATEPTETVDSGRRLLANVSATVHVRYNSPDGSQIREGTATATLFQQRWLGHAVTLEGGTPGFSTVQAPRLYGNANVDGSGAVLISPYGLSNTTGTFQPLSPNDPGSRQQFAVPEGATITGTSRDGSDTQVLSTAYAPLWVQVFASELLPKLGEAERFRRHFKGQGIEVWGDARTCTGLAAGNVQDLTGGAELRVNGRIYRAGSWAAIRVRQPDDSMKIWVLHLDGVLTREILGGQVSSCTLTELMTICRRPDLAPLFLKIGVLHTNWPHDRAALETSGPTLHLTDWQPWRDATRQEWGAAQASRPKWAEMITAETKLPPVPPLGLALADAATTGQWDAVPRNGSPHLLPTMVEVYSRANGWQVSSAALSALAKPLAYPGVTPKLDDRTSASGRLRVTYPAAPWALAQRRLVLSARIRTPINPVIVSGLSVDPLMLGREVQTKASRLLPARGWHPAALNVPVGYDPTQPLVLELDTRGQRLSRLLLSLVGPESGGIET